MRPRKARGCDLAFDISPENILLKGKLPDGAVDQVTVRVAAVVPFLVMKGIALEDRRKGKDAYDIHFVLRNYPGGVEALVEAVLPHLKHGLVQEGLRKIAAKFASVDHVGPKDAADFADVEDPEERTIRQRDAFERVNLLLQKLSML
jgi:predicted nucleotidyltransferase